MIQEGEITIEGNQIAKQVIKEEAEIQIEGIPIGEIPIGEIPIEEIQIEEMGLEEERFHVVAEVLIVEIILEDKNKNYTFLFII